MFSLHFSKTLPCWCANHIIFIFSSYNLVKFKYYLCSCVTLFNFLGFILQLFGFMQSTSADRFKKLLFYLFFWFSRVNVCFLDDLQVLKLKINLWFKSYLWCYLLLCADIFSYKTSNCLHYFLSHDFELKCWGKSS